MYVRGCVGGGVDLGSQRFEWVSSEEWIVEEELVDYDRI